MKIKFVASREGEYYKGTLTKTKMLAVIEGIDVYADPHRKELLMSENFTKKQAVKSKTLLLEQFEALKKKQAEEKQLKEEEEGAVEEEG